MFFCCTSDRKTYVYDEVGGFWRLTNYITFVTHNGSNNADILQRTGEAFVAFQRQKFAFPVAGLCKTIPNFHNTPKRLETQF